jgi:MoxR-like ATPase
MRFVVEYIKDKGSFHKLLSINKSLEPQTKVDVKDIVSAMEEIDDVELGDAEELIVTLWDAFNKNGFRLSDRKWRNSLRYMKANAWLNGRTSLTDDDVMIIKDMAWSVPEQIKPIRKLVFNTLNPAFGKAQDLYDAVCEVYAELESFTDDDVENKSKFGSTRGMKAAEVNNKLVSARKMIQTTIAQQKGKDVSTLESYVDSINTMVQGVTNILLGNI